MPPNDEHTDKQSIGNSMLLLLGSYIVALLLTTIVHELGHGLTLYSISIEFQLVLNPFSSSMTLPLSPIPQSALPLVSAAGNLVEIVFGTITFLFLWRWRSPKLMPLLMCAPVSYLSAAGYMLFGTQIPGDIMILISAGIPSILIQVIGVILLVVGAIVLLLMFPLLGISSADSFLRILVIMLGGMTLHGVAMIIFSLVTNPVELYIGIANVITMAMMIPVFVGVYKRAHSRLDRLQHTDSVQTGKSAVYLSIGLAVVFIILELMFFN